MKVNRADKESAEINLAAGQTESVSFTLGNEDAGTYTVDVNGLAGSYTVTAPVPKPAPAPSPTVTPPPPPAPAINWWLIGVLASSQRKVRELSSKAHFTGLERIKQKQTLP